MAPLFLLISQQRAASVFNTQSNHLKMLGELYDRCHETLEQFQVRTLSTKHARTHATRLTPRHPT